MKDYYQILGIPEESSQEEIRRAFRQLAFKHHPDKNPGREKEAGEHFKDINEAYCVLCDPDKRRQYDFARNGAGAYGARSGFGYSQQDIFASFFSNRSTVDDLNRLFAQSGLRFDEDLVQRTFFSGRGIIFEVYRSPSGTVSAPGPGRDRAAPTPKPSLIDRIAAGMIAFMFRLLFRLIFGSPRAGELDYHTGLEVSRQEAQNGVDKEVVYLRDGHRRKLVVKVPAGVTAGTKIRLRGKGKTIGRRSGDLYLHVKLV